MAKVQKINARLYFEILKTPKGFKPQVTISYPDAQGNEVRREFWSLHSSQSPKKLARMLDVPQLAGIIITAFEEWEKAEDRSPATPEEVATVV